MIKLLELIVKIVVLKKDNVRLLMPFVNGRLLGKNKIYYVTVELKKVLKLGMPIVTIIAEMREVVKISPHFVNITLD